jgi:dTDP-4-dehydrorhamnose 3,5-epimerase-like enzyme
MKLKLIDFKIKGDNTGSLIALEEERNIPFQIKRIYYIFDTKSNIKRGKHAHKKLQQVLVCVCGSCKIKLDNGEEKTEIKLDKPENGLLVDKMIWREMYDFSKDCVLLVLASEYYDEADYIRDYAKFLKLQGA